jgi:hypothetical protein
MSVTAAICRHRLFKKAMATDSRRTIVFVVCWRVFAQTVPNVTYCRIARQFLNVYILVKHTWA